MFHVKHFIDKLGKKEGDLLMRYIPIESVREGQYLAKSLYNSYGGLLVNEGVELTNSLINKIKESGFTVLAIEDKYTEEKIETIVKPQTVQKAINMSEKLSSFIESGFSNKVNECEKEFTELVEEVVEEIIYNKNSSDVIYNLVNISLYDEYVYKHNVNTMILSIAIGKNMGLNRKRIESLAIGSLLHDIGKTFISKEIINKKGRLTKEEYDIIKSHPQNGFDFLRKHTNLTPTERIGSLEHHERWDGTGYPYGKKRDETHIFSRIIAVCDVFEALTANRPYRKRISNQNAREYIIGDGGNQFDLDIIKVFAKTINPFPLNSLVRLSDGREGVVVGKNEDFLSRPVVKVYCENSRETSNYELNLMKTPNIVVDDIIYKFSFEEN